MHLPRFQEAKVTMGRTAGSIFLPSYSGKVLGRMFLYYRGLHHVSTAILTMKQTLRMTVDVRHFCCIDERISRVDLTSSHQNEWQCRGFVYHDQTSRKTRATGPRTNVRSQ